MCKYGFAENQDFIAIAQKRATAQIIQPGLIACVNMGLSKIRTL